MIMVFRISTCCLDAHRLEFRHQKKRIVCSSKEQINLKTSHECTSKSLFRREGSTSRLVLSAERLLARETFATKPHIYRIFETYRREKIWLRRQLMAHRPPVQSLRVEVKKTQLGRKESPGNVRYVLFWRKINYFRVRLKFLLFDLRPEGFRN